MLKRISVHQLTLGMHLQEFCGSWMEHPFFRTSFDLKDPKDIETILRSSIKEVWIDCGKGLDVVNGEAAVSEAESEAQVEDELKQVADGQRQLAPVSAAQELERAAEICGRAKQAVVSMFEEVRMGNAVDVGGAKLLVEEISDSVSRNPGALISLARLKTADDYTYMHSVAVCAMMVALAKQLGLDQAQTRSAGLAGLLHDLGKAVMPMDVLNKPGRLTDDEFTVIKSHPVEGHKMLLGGVNVDPIAVEVCLHHHEKMDGSGYPDRLEGDQISLWARMGAVCDVYDAITSNRPYKAGWEPSESIKKMASWRENHFDDRIFRAFVKMIGIYPVGSVVKTNSEKLGIVAEHNRDALLRPKIKVFFSTKSGMRLEPYVLDLSRPETLEKIVQREDPAQWNFPDLDVLWSGLPLSS